MAEKHIISLNKMDVLEMVSQIGINEIDYCSDELHFVLRDNPHKEDTIQKSIKLSENIVFDGFDYGQCEDYYIWLNDNVPESLFDKLQGESFNIGIKVTEIVFYNGLLAMKINDITSDRGNIQRLLDNSARYIVINTYDREIPFEVRTSIAIHEDLLYDLDEAIFLIVKGTFGVLDDDNIVNIYSDFESSVNQLMINHIKKLPKPFAFAFQQLLYKDAGDITTPIISLLSKETDKASFVNNPAAVLVKICDAIINNNYTIETIKENRFDIIFDIEGKSVVKSIKNVKDNDFLFVAINDDIYEIYCVQDKFNKTNKVHMYCKGSGVEDIQKIIDIVPGDLNIDLGFDGRLIDGEEIYDCMKISKEEAVSLGVKFVKCVTKQEATKYIEIAANLLDDSGGIGMKEQQVSINRT